MWKEGERIYLAEVITYLNLPTDRCQSTADQRTLSGGRESCEFTHLKNITSKCLGRNPTPATTQLHVPGTQSWATEGHAQMALHCCQGRVQIPTPHLAGTWLLGSLLLCSFSTDRLLWRIRRKDVICLIIHMTSPFLLVPQFLLEVPHF